MAVLATAVAMAMVTIEVEKLSLIIILLLLPSAAGALKSPTGSIELPKQPCCFSIDLKLDDIDPAWKCRLVFDRTDLQITDRTRETISAPQITKDGLPTARQWLVAARVLGRLAVRGIINWIGFRDLH